MIRLGGLRKSRGGEINLNVMSQFHRRDLLSVRSLKSVVIEICLWNWLINELQSSGTRLGAKQTRSNIIKLVFIVKKLQVCLISVHWHHHLQVTLKPQDLKRFETTLTVFLLPGATAAPFLSLTHRTQCETMLCCVHYLVNVNASLSALLTLIVHLLWFSW